jgi:hypothetical protein
MRLQALAIGLAAALGSLVHSPAALAAGNEVVIGHIEDLSGLYADSGGAGAVLPQRARPKDTTGLSRNLRLRNGRYYWHWDPAFFLQMAGELYGICHWLPTASFALSKHVRQSRSCPTTDRDTSYDRAHQLPGDCPLRPLYRQ